MVDLSGFKIFLGQTQKLRAEVQEAIHLYCARNPKTKASTLTPACLFVAFDFLERQCFANGITDPDAIADLFARQAALIPKVITEDRAAAKDGS